MSTLPNEIPIIKGRIVSLGEWDKKLCRVRGVLVTPNDVAVVKSDGHLEEEYFSWNEAEEIAKKLEKYDWRLPTKEDFDQICKYAYILGKTTDQFFYSSLRMVESGYFNSLTNKYGELGKSGTFYYWTSDGKVCHFNANNPLPTIEEPKAGIKYSIRMLKGEFCQN